MVHYRAHIYRTFKPPCKVWYDCRPPALEVGGRRQVSVGNEPSSPRSTHIAETWQQIAPFGPAKNFDTLPQLDPCSRTLRARPSRRSFERGYSLSTTRPDALAQ